MAHALTLALIGIHAAGQSGPAPDKVVLRQRSGYYVYHLAFSPNGKLLAAADERDVVVFDVDKGEESKRLSGVADQKKWDSVTAVVFSLDGTLLASVTRDGMVKVWEVATGKPRLEIKTRLYSLVAVAIDADNKAVAAVTGSTPWTAPLTQLGVWELTTGKEVLSTKLSASSYWVGELAFSADGRHLVGASRSLLTVWDVSTGRPRYALDEPKATLAAFSRDGKRFAGFVAGEGIVVWDTATGRAVHSLKTPANIDGVGGISFSPDGKHLAATPTTVYVNDATVQVRQTTALHIWEIGSGKVVLRRDTNENLPMVAFSPDGRRLALGNRDGLLQMWKNPIGR